MSAVFDRGEAQSLQALNAGQFTVNPDGLPISVSCWAYFDAAPGATATHTVWWYGEDGNDDKLLRLVANVGQGGGILFRAELKAGNNTIAVTTTVEYDANVWHCISVTLAEIGSPAEYELKLYVDGDAATADTTTAVGADVSDYDVFAMGRSNGSTKGDYATCYLEQIAVWNDLLADEDPIEEIPSDNQTMYDGRIAPADAATELRVASEPTVSYWMLAAHTRSALRIKNGHTAVGRGELINVADQPAGQRRSNQTVASDEPRWSARTPLFRWKFPRRPARTLPPKIPRSRLQPRFVFFQPPEAFSSTFDLVDAPIYSHPNFEVIARVDYGNTASSLIPPASGPFPYHPLGDVAAIAARLADWFAFLGFASGAGSEQSGWYEGTVYVREIGEGGIAGTRLRGWDGSASDPPFFTTGLESGMPILQHPFDHIDQVTSGDEVRELWDVWYSNEGVRLCREWSEHFWKALKDELDERGLAYPARFHWDYERHPDWGSAMHAPATPPPANIGNWGR